MMRPILLTVVMSLLVIIVGCSDDGGSTQPPSAPHALFTVTGGTVTPATLTFSNNSENADQYQWDFGDGRTSIQTSPSMTFDTHGQYVVTLAAIQSSTSQSDTARQTITITPGMFFLDTLSVEQFPFTDPNGAGWDLTTGPDLTFALMQGSNTIRTGSVIYDLTPQQLPVGWYFNPAYRVTNWDATYSIDLYDYDAGSANDYIGTTSFSVNGIIARDGYQSESTLQNSQQTIRVVLAVRWQ